jgi:hypothetical protein
MKRHFATAVFLFLVSIVTVQPAQTMRSQTYRMTLGTMYKTHEFVFLIHPLVFLSLPEVKDFVATFPAGSTLEWAPSDIISQKNQPLTSEQENDLKDYCLKKKVKFVHIPAG